MEPPKISVIVPVYNVEKYLSQCVESILSQSFQNFELLLINDGSKDDSGLICDKYQSVDSRAIVIHKENGGVSSARNIGLEQAKGEWICFVDSDDYVTKEYLQELYSVAELGADLVIQGNIQIDGNGKILLKDYYENTVYYSSLFDKMLIEQALYYKPCPWAKLFSAKIITDNEVLFHPNIRFGEDLCFLFSYLQFVNTVRFSNKSNYFYLQRSDSATCSGVFDFESEFVGYKYLEITMVPFLKKSFRNQNLPSEYLSRLSFFLHRSILAITSYSDFYKIRKEDWLFWKKNFIPESSIQRIDKWIIGSLLPNYFCMLYLRMRRWLFAVRKSLY